MASFFANLAATFAQLVHYILICHVVKLEDL